MWQPPAEALVTIFFLVCGGHRPQVSSKCYDTVDMDQYDVATVQGGPENFQDKTSRIENKREKDWGKKMRKETRRTSLTRTDCNLQRQTYFLIDSHGF